MTTYKQPEKDKSRVLLWNHAVESLTSLRDSNRILNTTYMEHLWLYCQQQLNEKLAYIIHSGFISGYQNRYGDNLKPPTNVYHRMTA